MSQAEIFDRAAQCERASREAADPERQKVLALLREMWIAVANESPFLSPAELSQQFRVVENIHARALEAATDQPQAAQSAP